MTDKNKIYDELLKEAKGSLAKKQADEFSANDFAKDAHISTEYARKYLTKLVEAGILRSRLAGKYTFYSII